MQYLQCNHDLMVYKLMLYCVVGEQRSARAVGNQPWGVSGAEAGWHVWQHVSLSAAHQHRRQSEEELKVVRDSWVYKPSSRAALQVPQSSITGSHALTVQPGCPSAIPREGFCRKGLWNLSNTEIWLLFHHHGFSLEVKSAEYNHLWNNKKIGILWMITLPEHKTL